MQAFVDVPNSSLPAALVRRMFTSVQSGGGGGGRRVRDLKVALWRKKLQALCPLSRPPFAVIFIVSMFCNN